MNAAGRIAAPDESQQEGQQDFSWASHIRHNLFNPSFMNASLAPLENAHKLFHAWSLYIYDPSPRENDEENEDEDEDEDEDDDEEEESTDSGIDDDGDDEDDQSGACQFVSSELTDCRFFV
ncbi:putative uncharacterized protein YGR160W [Ceratina calcarata]|uniref:Uncharacterized protein n=1 Tax=Ceratina calcarata TaxID=156304 RepID=A0AAJ7N9B7_9HYME|nr:putative uncharacterized protein YGR160W [Ceratina calcarata]